MSEFLINKIASFTGHRDSVYALEKIDDSSFVSSGADGMVIKWDTNHPEKAHQVAQLKGSVYTLKHHKNILYFGENRSGISKIDLSKKNQISLAHTTGSNIFDLKIIHDKTLWACLSKGEVLKMKLDLRNNQSFKYVSTNVRSIDSYENILSIGCSDKTIKVIDQDTKEVQYNLQGHSSSVFKVKYHPSGKYLISGGRDAHLLVWDASNNYLLREKIPAHLYTINDIVFSDCGKYFFTASKDKTIKLWDAYNFQLLKVVDNQRHNGHTNSINKLILLNKDYIVSCSDDRQIIIWKFEFNS